MKIGLNLVSLEIAILSLSLSLSLSLYLKFVEISLGFGLDLLRSSEISSRSSEIWTKSFEIYERSHWYPMKSRLHYFGNFFKNRPSSTQAKTDSICAWCWSVAGVFLLHSIQSGRLWVKPKPNPTWSVDNLTLEGLFPIKSPLLPPFSPQTEG